MDGKPQKKKKKTRRLHNSYTIRELFYTRSTFGYNYFTADFIT